MRKIFISLLLCATALLAKPVVTASILPTKYFIERIAADTLEVNVMVLKGADAHTYEPKPKQMSELEKSKLYFAVGIEFENTWLARFSNSFKNLKIINTHEGIERIAMSGGHHEHENHEHHEHKHGEKSHKHEAHEHDDKAHSHETHEHNDKTHSHEAHNHKDHEHEHHEHGALDPHIWLDPLLVKTQARNIADALIANFPEHAELYKANLEAFLTQLDVLDRFIAQTLKDATKREFIVYHPSWGYFAKRYELEQIAIEIEGKEPKPAQLASLIQEAKEHGVRVVFVAPQFSKKAASLIATQAGARVEEIDQLPLEWEEELRKMAQILAQSLR